MNFYKKYLIKCTEKNESPSAAALNAGLTKTSVNRWKNGSTPTDATILRLALYFGCPPDDLTPDAEPEEKETPTPEAEDGLSDADRRLIEWFRSLPPEKQKAILIAQDAPSDVV